MVNKPVNQISPGLQFPIFLMLSVALIVVFNLIALGIAGGVYGLDVLTDLMQMRLTNPNLGKALYLLQIIGTTLPLFLAPVIFAYFIVREPGPYLKAGRGFPWMLIVVALLIALVSSPMMEFLSNINQQMALPLWLHGLETWMKESEKSAEKLIGAILQMNTIWDLLKNLFLVAFLTAIAEEFMFRGALQTILLRWTKNTHAAVWIGAALFSAFHMEFYGFLPRMMLGIFFGYFVAWSGSIWPAVWAHFLNNGTVVVVTYLYNKKIIKVSPDDQHVFSYTSYIISLIIIIILLLVYKRIAGERHRPLLNGEELG